MRFLACAMVLAVSLPTVVSGQTERLSDKDVKDLKISQGFGLPST
jgi:hypothetical protein